MASARTLKIVAVAALIIASVFAFRACSNAPASQSSSNSSGGPKTETVVIGGENFDLELATDEAARQQGLMNRATIPDHTGMIFVFPDNLVQVQNFWMGHCLTDMDIIFLDSHGVVTATHHMKAEAPQAPNESDVAYDRRMRRYSSGYPAQFAIELPPGSLERLNVRVDDRISLNLEHLKAMAE